MPRDESTFPDDHFIEVDDVPTYQSTNAKLNFANKTKSDPLQGISWEGLYLSGLKLRFSGISEPRQYLVQSLSSLGSSMPGQLPAVVNNISQESANILQGYLAKYGVQLV